MRRESIFPIVCFSLLVGACGGDKKVVRPDESPKAALDKPAAPAEASEPVASAPASESPAAPSSPVAPAAVDPGDEELAAQPASPVPAQPNQASANTAQSAVPSTATGAPRKTSTRATKPPATPPAGQPAPPRAKDAPAASLPSPPATALRVPAGWTAEKTVLRTWKAKCGTCHGTDGRAETEQGKKMGVMDMTAAAYWKGKTLAELRQSVSNGINRVVEGKKQEMKGFKVSLKPEDIDALVYYALSFRK